MVLGLKGQRSKLGLRLGLTATRRGFELYECLLVIIIIIIIVVVVIALTFDCVADMNWLLNKFSCLII